MEQAKGGPTNFDRAICLRIDSFQVKQQALRSSRHTDLPSKHK